MKAIIGLGNPGKKYEWTRHNMGFIGVDAVAHKARVPLKKNRFDGTYGEFVYFGEKIVLLKPQTYMNRSGAAVQALHKYYKAHLSIEHILIVYDDIALPLGTMRLRERGSAGGHNGMQSIIETLETMDIPRLRVGIKGAAPIDDLAAFVLQTFASTEKKKVADVRLHLQEACFTWLDYGIHKAMNIVNAG